MYHTRLCDKELEVNNTVKCEKRIQKKKQTVPLFVHLIFE